MPPLSYLARFRAGPDFSYSSSSHPLKERAAMRAALVFRNQSLSPSVCFALVGVSSFVSIRRFRYRTNLKLVGNLLNSVGFFCDPFSFSFRFSSIDGPAQSDLVIDHVDVDLSLWRLRVSN